MLVMAQDLRRWAQARYRVGQFLRGWRARLTDADHRLVDGLLAPPAWALFNRMPADAQLHSVRVLRTLQGQGPTPADLAVAALLHDVGKVAAADAGAYLGLWLRGPIVLLEAFAPQWLARLAAPQPSASPRYALYVQLTHAQIGAEWAQAAGCSELTCWLIAHHQDEERGARGEGLEASSTATVPGFTTDLGAPAPRPSSLAPQLLTRLQWADGRN